MIGLVSIIGSGRTKINSCVNRTVRLVIKIRSAGGSQWESLENLVEL